ncbi:MAG: UPF0716 protein FxsA [Candidatus Azotimanducaceae bacterium]|jgi:UPF0716 protein FxsA
MRFFLLVFIIVPVIEMFILIRVGSMIGALPTIALVVLTATVGVWLLKREGLATLARLQNKIASGEIPGKELLEGVMLIIGGALLLTPGFVTDAVGFVCLLPGLRGPLAVWLLKHTQFMQGGFQMGAGRAGGSFTFQGRTFEGQSTDSPFDSAVDSTLNRPRAHGPEVLVSPVEDQTPDDYSAAGQHAADNPPRTIDVDFEDLDPPQDSKP